MSSETKYISLSELKVGMEIQGYKNGITTTFHAADEEGLRRKIFKLEQQIEKMKCCENCGWWYRLPNGQKDCAEECENLSNWSLRK